MAFAPCGFCCLGGTTFAPGLGLLGVGDAAAPPVAVVGAGAPFGADGEAGLNMKKYFIQNNFLHDTQEQSKMV